MNEHINISHSDLDGITANLVLREKFGDMDSYHVSYGAVKETLQMIDADITHHTRTLFVTDLSFDVEAFNELMRISESHKHLNIIYIDHHPYEGEVLEAFEELKTFPNVFTSHVIGKSATLLTYEFTHSTHEDLGKLVKWVDAFDIYKEFEDPANFKIGWFLNTIFWQIKTSGFKSSLIQNDFKIPKYFKELYKETIKEKDIYFEKLIKQGLVVFDEENNLLLSFSDHHKSFWQADYPEYDYYILPYHTKGNNISVRFSHRVPEKYAKLMKDDILKYVKQNPWVVSAGGHNFAHGISINNEMPKDEHLELIEGIVDVIQSWNQTIHMPF